MLPPRTSLFGLFALVAVYIIIVVVLDDTYLLSPSLPPGKIPPPDQLRPDESWLKRQNRYKPFNNDASKLRQRQPRAGAFQPFRGPMIVFLDGNKTDALAAPNQGQQGRGLVGGARKRRDNHGKPVKDFLESSARNISILDNYMIPDSENVLIYGRYRGGSTFFGDFFRTNLELQYMFEPLNRGSNDYSPRNDTELILGQMFACNFDTIYQYNGASDLWLKQCVFCRYPKPVTSCIRHLPEVAEEEATSTCLNAKTRVIKTIRVEYLDHLVAMMKKGLKVVQLVRDPRGTMCSRLAIHAALRSDPVVFREEARDLCARAVRDVDTVRRLHSKVPDLIQSNYYVVRYEDIAKNTSLWLAEVYKFIGRKPDEASTAWAKMTDIASQSEPRETQMKMYETRRENPRFTSMAWRLKFDLKLARIVEEVCSDFLDIYRYDVIPSEERQRDMSVSLVSDFHMKSMLKS